MISDTLSASADACAPDANRDGAAMPANIARLLSILRVLLDFGRHLAATIERVAATRDFWLFSAVFGTAKLPVIHAHLRRGLLRAATLESMLLQRAATGRDVAISPRPTRTAPSEDTDPCNEPFDAQVARLTADRAQHDAPADPDNPATPEQIESEVRACSIGRAIADIRRDLGIIAMMCTREFWDAMTDATHYFEDTAAEWPQDTHAGPEPSQPEPMQQSDQKQTDRHPILYPRQRQRFKIAAQPVAPSRPGQALTRQRINVPLLHRHAVVAAATGPPPRAAAKRAA